MLEVGDGYEKTDVRTNDKKIKWLVIISVVLVATRNGWNWYCIGIPHEMMH
mgnify:CR=1 FL=1